MNIEITEFDKALASLQPKIGNYNWMWALMRAKARNAHGHLPWRLMKLLKPFFREDKPFFIAKTGDGTQFVGDHRDAYSILSAVFPSHDRRILEFVGKKAAAANGAFLDIGANMGVVSAYMARTALKSETVFAFEPIPDTAIRAAATFALNGVKNVRLFQVALGDQVGEIVFYVTEGHSACATTNPGYRPDLVWTETRVPCCTLDSLLEDGLIPKIGFMKVDVEGHEPKVMAGAAKSIGRDKPSILFEYNEIATHAGWTVSDLTQIIGAAAPYQFETLETDGSLVPVTSNFQPDHQVDVYCHP